MGALAPPGHCRPPSPTSMRCVGSCGVSRGGFPSFAALGTSTHELGLLVASTQLPPDGAGVRRPSKPPWGASAVLCPGNVLSRCHHGMRGVCELGRAGIPARSGPSPRAAEAEGPGAPRERRAPSPAFLAATGRVAAVSCRPAGGEAGSAPERTARTHRDPSRIGLVPGHVTSLTTLTLSCLWKELSSRRGHGART